MCRWGREGDAGIDAFRKEIRKAFGGRAPRVPDPFAGGGAVPLGAMRLGCEATAADINPVARFIPRCTLHYPHSMAGRMGALRDCAFMEAFLKAQGARRRGRRARPRRTGGAPQSQRPLQGLPVSDGAGSAIAVTAQNGYSGIREKA